ncbi:hypothetical protein L249_6239, partial [Ophiocordyceps polyrhachis-furcata BCC 54312]
LPEPESLAKEYFWSLPIVAERGNFFKKKESRDSLKEAIEEELEAGEVFVLRRYFSRYFKVPTCSTLTYLYAIKRLDAKLVLVSLVPLVDFQGRLASSPNDLPALAKYSLSILLPKTPLLNRQIDPAV